MRLPNQTVCPSLKTFDIYCQTSCRNCAPIIGLPYPFLHYLIIPALDIVNFFLKYRYIFIFRERGKEKERERNIHVWLPLTRPLLGTWPATQACALTGIRTHDPLVRKSALNLPTPARAYFSSRHLLNTRLL